MAATCPQHCARLRRFRSIDPVLVIPPMALETKHLGFGVTCTLSSGAAVSVRTPHVYVGPPHEWPHRTGDIVYGLFSIVRQRASGMDAQTGHDLRYAIADEYMEVM